MTIVYKVKKRSGLLKVDRGSFATLVHVANNNDVTFEFRYVVDQVRMLDEGIKNVIISIKKNTLSSTPIVKGRSSNDVVDRILRQSSSTKKLDKQRATELIVKKTSDISSRINNELIRIKDSGTVDEILTKSKLVARGIDSIVDNNDVKPVFDRVAHVGVTNLSFDVSSSVRFREQDLMYDMISRRGVDPSIVSTIQDRAISSQQAFEGTTRAGRDGIFEHDSESLLYNRHTLNDRFNVGSTSELDIQSMVNVVEQTRNRDIEIVEKIVITNRTIKSLKDRMNVIVEFDMIDQNSGTSIESISYELDIAERLKFFYTPRVPPVVGLAIANLASTTTFNIRQLDRGATRIDVYRKNINVFSTVNDNYELVETIRARFGQQVNFNTERKLTSTVIYRFVPTGQRGSTCAEYTNVVVKPQRFVNDRSLSLITRSVETGVKVELRLLPPGIEAFQILTKNLTTFESNYRVVNDRVEVVDDKMRASSTFVTIDRLATINHVHEYIVKIHYRSGVHSFSTSSVIERCSIEVDKVDVQVRDVVVTNGVDKPNVTFTIDARLLDGQLDSIKKMLVARGLESVFEQQILDNRESLKDLMAFNVQRLNLTTGDREDFGVLVESTFDDSVLASSAAVNALQYGNKYQYEVSVLLRSAESLFEVLSKQSVDNTTKKKYSYNPQKFRHPLTLNEGIILTNKGQQLRSKNAMSYGRTGSYAIVDVSFDDSILDIRDFQVERFDERFNVLTWNVDSTLISKIDHFLIMKDVNGVRTIVGKSHGNFAFGRYRFFHELQNSVGEMKYAIVVIRNDYTIGNEAISNSVIVK